MALKFKCADIGMACGFETTAETKDQLLQQIGAHAKEVHNMAAIAPDVMAKIQAAIKQV